MAKRRCSPAARRSRRTVIGGELTVQLRRRRPGHHARRCGPVPRDVRRVRVWRHGCARTSRQNPYFSFIQVGPGGSATDVDVSSGAGDFVLSGAAESNVTISAGGVLDFLNNQPANGNATQLTSVFVMSGALAGADPQGVSSGTGHNRRYDLREPGVQRRHAVVWIDAGDRFSHRLQRRHADRR